MHDHHQVNARHAIDHGMVDFPDNGRRPIRPAAQDDHLPQGMVAVELRRVHLTSKFRQHPVVSGRRQVHLFDVLLYVKRGVILPGWMRNP